MKRSWIIFLAALYLISPIDLLPDFILGIGWLDDLALAGFVLYYLFYMKKRREPSPSGARFREDPRSNQKQEGAPRPSPYQVLGVDRNATKEEIKTAYRRLAGQYHPDRVSHLGEEFRVLAEQKFKEIQEAYQELSSGRR